MNGIKPKSSNIRKPKPNNLDWPSPVGTGTIKALTCALAGSLPSNCEISSLCCLSLFRSTSDNFNFGLGLLSSRPPQFPLLNLIPTGRCLVIDP
ncbi:hypothetical protein SDJN02_21682, partial [Cucurbita argyrosperma subsp. argyrosperma]